MNAKIFILLNLHAAGAVEMMVKKDIHLPVHHYFTGIVNRITEHTMYGTYTRVEQVYTVSRRVCEYQCDGFIETGLQNYLWMSHIIHRNQGFPFQPFIDFQCVASQFCFRLVRIYRIYRR